MKSRLNPVLILFSLVVVFSGGGLRAQSARSAGSVAALGTAFTYQGRLSDGGNPANGAYDFRFIVYDAELGGAQVGPTIVYKEDVPVAQGLFTVYLDFGANVFTGGPRYLDIGIRPGSSTGDYTPLNARQLISPTPYAMYSASTGALQGQAVSATAPQLAQVLKWDGSQWVAASTDHDHYGASWSGSAVLGLSVATSARGTGAAGLYGLNGAASGLKAAPAGIWGDTSGAAIGVLGTSNTGVGVTGLSDSYQGVYGHSNLNAGVVGESQTFYGLYGISHGSVFGGVFGTNDGGGYAGVFDGKVRVTGFLEKAGGGFVIDHPLDPANKYLYHSFVESPDMKNIYDGVVTLDASGTAVVELPDWFEALNQEFRYQLTAIGAPAPDLYIAQEIQGLHFAIGGGKPGMKVSWQVTGIRHDPWAEQHRMQVEVVKPPQERGKFLYPTEYGQPESLGITYSQRLQSGQAGSQASGQAR